MDETEISKDVDGRSSTKGVGRSSARSSEIQKMKAAKLAQLKAKMAKEAKVDNREETFRKTTGTLKQGCGSGSAWIHVILASRIRIRIQVL